jgi:hypothetical protein
MLIGEKREDMRNSGGVVVVLVEVVVNLCVLWICVPQKLGVRRK